MQKNIIYKKEKSNFFKFSYIDWIKGFSVGKKLTIIMFFILFILLFELFNFWIAMKVTSGIRSYVYNEGLYSKGQKEAYSSLIKYYTNFNEQDYINFINLLEIYPLGAMNFRLELNKDNPNYSIPIEMMARQGQDPNDFNNTIWLYRWFKDISYMKEAVKVWEQADAKVLEFRDVGNRIHNLVNKSYNKDNAEEVVLRSNELSKLIQEADYINNQLTEIEDNFSRVLGEASRAIANILLAISLILGGFIGIFVLFVSVIISKTLVQVDNAKSEFVSWASHQLRTPITSVKWRSEMLLQEKTGLLNEKQKNYVKEIYYGNERMIKLVNNLLSTAHIEMGKFRISPRQVDVKVLIQDIIREQQPEIEKKNHTINVNENNSIPTIFSDPVLLTVIFQNLLSNAIKYTNQDGQIVCNMDVINNKLLVEFRDNGIGIPEAEQKRIFEKTYRASNALEKSSEGNGLGMYIIKGMIKVLGGKIWFKSKINEGTSFYLELPLSISDKSK